MEGHVKFNVLDRRLDVTQKRFLEASAGTGKTFAIEHLYVRLLIEGGLPLIPKEILVVTFTRASTRELKKRIRSNIEKALRELEKGQSPIDYLQSQIENGAKRAIQRLKGALATADQMQIFTIHGFCHKMLEEAAFDAQESFILTDPDEQGYKVKMRKVVMDYFRTGLTHESYSNSQLYRLIKHHTHQVSSLSDAVVKLLEKGALIEPQVSFLSALELFQNKLKEMPVVTASECEEDLLNLMACYTGMTAPEFKEQAQKLASLIEKRKCSEEEFNSLLKDKEYFLGKMSESTLKKKFKPPVLHTPGLLECLQSQLYPIIRQSSDLSALHLRIASDCQKRWEEKGLATFPDELIKKMARCLDNPAFVKKAQETFKAAIIDEFQDTDPLQWDIFDRLFPKTLCVVGDPKQSIYAFRGADVRTYLRAKESFNKDQLAFLETNFRSEPPLVDALNELFHVPGPWMPGLDVMRITAGKSSDKTPLNDGRGHVHFFIAESKAEKGLFHPFITEELKHLSQLGSCAVLVSTNAEAKEVHAFLNASGVPAVMKRAGSLIDSPAYVVMRDLFYAVKEPRNMKAVKRALAGPLFGWSVQELQMGRDEPRFKEALDLLHEWNGLLEERGAGAMLGALLSRYPLSASWAGAFRQLVELILSVKEDPLLFLEEMKHFNVEDDERLKVRQEESCGRVVIMTSHVSKGLEFDFVFALGVASGRKSDEKILNVNGRLVPFDSEDEECQKVIKNFEAEKMRQFYVALTRAKRRVYVALQRDEAYAPSTLFCQQLGEDLYAVFEALKAKTSFTYSILKEGIIPAHRGGPSPPEEVPLLERKDLPEFPYSSLTSFSSMAQKKAIDIAPREEGMLPPGTETGQLLHRIMELALFSPEDLRGIIAREVEYTPLAGFEEKIFTLLNPLFDLELSSEGICFTLREIPKNQLFEEMEFLFPHQDKMIKGFIDLVVIWQGRFFFIDWKSNVLKDYTHANLQLAMEQHDYLMQAAIYKEALCRYFESFSLKFGGAFYIFLRGSAVLGLETGDLKRQLEEQC